MKAKFVNEGFVLKPKSEDDIIKDLTLLSQEELNQRLIEASRRGLNVIPLLINAGANVNVKDEYDRTPLMFASRDGELNNILLLISAGADVNAMNDDGGTSLMYASLYGQKEIFELLKKYGAKK